MRLGIVPIELLLTTPDFIAIGVYGDRQAIECEPLTNNEADSIVEVELSGNAGKRRAPANESQSRMPDRRKLVGKSV